MAILVHSRIIVFLLTRERGKKARAGRAPFLLKKKNKKHKRLQLSSASYHNYHYIMDTAVSSQWGAKGKEEEGRQGSSSMNKQQVIDRQRHQSINQ